MLNTLTTAIAQKTFDLTPQRWRQHIRDHLPLQWVRTIKALITEQQMIRFQDSANPAIQLENKLWGGFSYYALQDLHHLQQTTTDGHTRFLTSWVLAKWYWAQANYAVAYQHLLIAKQARPVKNLERGLLLLETDCLVQLDQHLIARELITSTTNRTIKNSHMLLALANTYVKEECKSSDEQQLEIINRIFGKKKLALIEKKQKNEPLSLDNLQAQQLTPKIPPSQQTLVSVIMPAYNAAKTITMALDSLLAQTWKNIEIIVVDDCSQDTTINIAKQYQCNDSRIKVYQLPENRGAYTCRNYGLKFATGELVTTHDADDWSHPQKIEIQAHHLLKKTRFKANITDWVRTLPNLLFRGTSRPSERWIQMNHSSLMLYRQLLCEMGGWDEVRIAADTELIWRLEKYPKAGKPARLLQGIPLSFALEDPESLTRFSKTHVRTIYYGARHQYRSSAKFWHDTAKPASLTLTNHKNNRTFPAPKMILPTQNVLTTQFDVVHILDINNPDGILGKFLDTIENTQSTDSIAIFNWPYYQNKNFNNQLPTTIHKLIHEGRLVLITPGESVKSHMAVVWQEKLINYIPDLFPNFDIENLYLHTDAISPMPDKIAEEKLYSTFKKLPQYVDIQRHLPSHE